MSEEKRYYEKDYRSGLTPVWCPGCGNYATLKALIGAFTELQIPPHEIMVSSGIGCSSRLPYFLSAYSFHGVHGRAVPVGTGMKAARPELTTVVIGGDGDGYSIGIGHIIHAARKNVNITYIVADNSVYGLTKGQQSPTTWVGQRTSTSVTGAVDPPFKPVLTILAARASFVARGSTAKPDNLQRFITAGVRHRGFSFIEVLTPCPTFNPAMDAKRLREMMKPVPDEHDVTDLGAAMRLALDESAIYCGVFHQREAPTYNDHQRRFQEQQGLFDDEEVGIQTLIDEFV